MVPDMIAQLDWHKLFKGFWRGVWAFVCIAMGACGLIIVFLWWEICR
jgi:hypothetical protein